jgi:hypothetical protein
MTSVRAVLPQSARESPALPSPPKSFEEANRMVQEVWQLAFPSLRFPVNVIGIFPRPKPSLLECHSSNNIKKNHRHQPTTPTSWKLLCGGGSEEDSKKQHQPTHSTHQVSACIICCKPSPQFHHLSRVAYCPCLLHLPVGGKSHYRI